MGLFDRFKKTKKEEKGAIEKVRSKSLEPRIKAVSKKGEKETAGTSKIIKKEFTQAYRILERPLVTEKSTNLNILNQYVFQVKPDANKSEIKKTIQDLYGVKVKQVNIVKVPGKVRRMGRHEGFRPGYKKAIVFLAPGETIEIITR